MTPQRKASASVGLALILIASGYAALRSEPAGSGAGQTHALNGQSGGARRLVAAGLGVVDADEHAGAAAGEAGRDDAGRFHRLPGQFEQQAVLRIDLAGLARRHAKEIRVEQIDPVEKSAGPGVDALRRMAALGMKAEIPATAVDLADAITALLEIVPERIQIRRFRIAPAQADDGQRRRSGGCGPVRRRRTLGGLQSGERRYLTGHGAEPLADQPDAASDQIVTSSAFKTAPLAGLVANSDRLTLRRVKKYCSASASAR